MASFVMGNACNVVLDQPEPIAVLARHEGKKWATAIEHERLTTLLHVLTHNQGVQVVYSVTNSVAPRPAAGQPKPPPIAPSFGPITLRAAATGGAAIATHAPTPVVSQPPTPPATPRAGSTTDAAGLSTSSPAALAAAAALVANAAAAAPAAVTSLAVPAPPPMMPPPRSAGGTAPPPNAASAAAPGIVRVPRMPTQLATMSKDLAHAVTILAACARGSASFITGNAMPMAHKMWFTNEVFTAAIWRRLRHRLVSNNVPCPLCRTKQCDPYGDHIATCMSGGRKTFAHSHLLAELTSLARAANAGPRTEYHPFPEPHANLRMDVVMALPDAARTTAFVDVAITHHLAGDHIRGNHYGPGAAATAYEAVKRSHYHAAMQSMPAGTPPVHLVPFVFDSLGGVGESAVDAIRTLSRAWAVRNGAPTSSCVRQAFHRLTSTAIRSFAEIAVLQMSADAPVE
jgi:hypothetical protein